MSRSGTVALRGSILLLLVLLSGGTTRSPFAAAVDGASPAGAPRVQEARGAIAGAVEVGGVPRRRTTNRYRGRSASPARHEVQALPAVVYLEGAVPGPSGADRSDSGPRRGSASVSIVQRDTAFVPPVVVVPVGGTVAFPNEDDFFHNVFSYSGPKRFDLGRYPQGESKAEVFDRPGIVQVFCEVHEQMRSVILVAENPHHDVVSDDGTFTIPEVPPGTHRLVLWHPDAGRREMEVEVRPGETTNVSAELP